MEKTNEEVYTTQKANIRKHLESGKTITPLEALNLYGCFRLAAQIHKLKNNDGLDIVTEMVTRNGKHIAQYRLA